MYKNNWRELYTKWSADYTFFTICDNNIHILFWVADYTDQFDKATEAIDDRA